MTINIKLMQSKNKALPLSSRLMSAAQNACKV